MSLLRCRGRVATVQQARESRHLWSLACACLCMHRNGGDRNCKYQTWQMSFYSCVSGILLLEEEILKRWRHNRKLFIASVLSAAQLRDGSLFFSFIRCVMPYTHRQVFSLCVNASQQQKQSLAENCFLFILYNNKCLYNDTYPQYIWTFQEKECWELPRLFQCRWKQTRGIISKWGKPPALNYQIEKLIRGLKKVKLPEKRGREVELLHLLAGSNVERKNKTLVN